MEQTTGSDDDTAAPRPWRSRALYGVLLAVFTWLYVSHPQGRFTKGGLIHGDGVYYYAYARSILLDGDVDFTNDYKLLGNPHRRGKTESGYRANRFTIGPALMWIPSFAAAQVVTRAGAGVGVLDVPCDGSSALHQRITLFASTIWGFLAILLSVRVARRFAPPAAATLAGVGVLVASPLPWYMVYQPSWPHATAAFTVAAFVYLWCAGYGERTVRGWCWLGLLAGLMILCRLQSALFCLLPAYELAVTLARAVRSERRGAAARRWALGAATFAAALMLAFTPQMLAWNAIYGEPLTIPQGESFMRWGESRWAAALFSSRAGLFAWTPIVYVGVLGLVALALRRPRGASPSARVAAGLLLVVFGMQAYVNGAVVDWWGGWAYGGRRFTACTVAFVVGLAVALDGLRALLAWRPNVVIAGLVAAPVAAFGLCNVERMDAYRTGRLERGGSQSMAAANQEAAGRWIERVYEYVGHPGSAPASWLFAARAGVSPARYDRVSGWELVNGRGNTRGWSVIKFPDERWAMGGFGPGSEISRTRCSLIVGDGETREAVIAIPVRTPEALDAVLLARAGSPGTRMTLTLGGDSVAELELDEVWREFGFSIPASALTSGINLARVRVDPGEPAALSEINLGVGATGLRSPVDVEVSSDATKSGDGATFHVGLETYKVGARGVTAIVVTDGAEGGESGFMPIGTFDTALDKRGAERFAAAIAAVPDGAVVALAFSRKALHLWTPAASAAVESLGARMKLERDKKSLSYALIGIKGAARGAVVERRSRRSSVSVLVGRPPATRVNTVALSWIALSRAGVEAKLPGAH